MLVSGYKNGIQLKQNTYYKNQILFTDIKLLKQ